ncbi:sensor histidine kinase [Tenacibaculum sp. IB213877]|uniref:sensor histidine kinase n=1 Tax=Tenacibaculum sp. IB213877 TaxID=3097351 RepID=UPI002A5993DF|nr:histidine kinase [Tenacibaculum sp. IB213877]MDY0780226.1 histidine kinase [Tenacibaculum sp. IB213877]
MILSINNKQKLFAKYFIGISIIIPILIIGYEVIILGKDSVILLANYPSIFSILVLIYYSLLFLAGFAWILSQLKQVLNLKNEKVKNELQHLKTQVSPHFFFNMLNNLYGLIEKDTSKAKKLVLELSEMMRYSIYKSQHDYVTLKEEIQFIQNYLNLHKMRYHKEVDINFSIEVDNEDLKIMPLLFINLVENAFKHGVENLTKDAYVYIKLISKEGKIYFEVENNFDEELSQEEGVGLQNLFRRLELTYPSKYSLSSTSIGDVFNTKLNLTIL